MTFASPPKSIKKTQMIRGTRDTLEELSSMPDVPGIQLRGSDTEFEKPFEQQTNNQLLLKPML